METVSIPRRQYEIPLVTDIDECANPHCTLNSHCTNTVGSFTCDCDQGYTLQNEACVGKETLSRMRDKPLSHQ